MFALNSMLHLIKLRFHNNTGNESAALIAAEFSQMTLLRLEINSTNSYGSLISAEGSKIKVIDSAVINTVNYLIIYATDSENPAADELKTGVSSLIILNTTISENHIENAVVYAKIKGAFEILYCLFQNNT